MYLLPLPPRQAAVYQFLRSFIAEKGYPPTIREIAKSLDITSPNGAFIHVKALEAKGYITHDPHRSRTIMIVA